MNKKRLFNRICKDIKAIKIQGASNIAKAALKAYSLFPTKASIKKLESLRPTEPMLVNTLKLAEKLPSKKILQHFSDAQNKINLLVLKLIKQNSTIFTHCHSTNVTKALIFVKKKGKKFDVYNTETRPLFQGRKTARELIKAGIKITTYVDSAARIAITKSGAVVLGADAILQNGNVINKVGSGMFAEIAHAKKIPVYIIADSWKFSSRNIKIEERQHKEVWKNAPEHIRIKNPSFEVIEKKYITAIISEYGILKPEKFVKKIKSIKRG
ncbi:translation initiation factor eIF-2B [Candidatus Pacearchaeota archaeon]|nr:translation initiation factor eIF-2B [Candidatus Pacearchaeota archaeon]